MTFQFQNLPYKENELEPFISEQTMNFHFKKHYKKYIANLNALLVECNQTPGSLKEALLKYHTINDAIFQNAAQAWNHEFFWNCLSPQKTAPSPVCKKMLKEHFGSYESFKSKFLESALGLFGSGWIWVVKNSSGGIGIMALGNAENPMTSGHVPLLVCDVWEHAYYLDYQNDRTKYLNQFWQVLNWNFFDQNLEEDSQTESQSRVSDVGKISRG